MTIHLAETLAQKSSLKFDIIVGNPPYNAPQIIRNEKGKRGGGDSLWDKFVKLALNNLLKENGYLCYVHPPKWRKPEDELWDLMTNKQIEYLEIHSSKDGRKVFNAGTRYDWYVLKNTEYKKETIVIDELGKENKIDLKEWNFLPNYNFKEIKKYLAKNNEETYITLYDSSIYTAGRTSLLYNKNKTKIFKFPHCYGSDDGNIRFIYSKNKIKGFFDTPKIILIDNIKSLCINDYDGRYGISNSAFGIKINSKKEADELFKYLNSTFKTMAPAFCWSSFRIDFKIFNYFKKQFYKKIQC